MSDKSDLNCFKGHILNEESTERKLYTQETPRGLLARQQPKSARQQPKPRQ